MRSFQFDDDQITAIRGALELAGEKYRQNAAELAQQFVRQADDASALLDLIDY